MVIHYQSPRHWILYDWDAISTPLLNAKAAMLALTQMPYQRSWADKLQEVQLKREVAGTSRIEGAEFTEPELDAALHQAPTQLATRSQRQAASAVATYRWIAKLSGDQPITRDLSLEVHRRLVTGCDDDHCPPGELRPAGSNVTFGSPLHRGADGGEVCARAIDQLLAAARTAYRDHDPLVQALALHYHIAAMHPFLDGNGRTARALEAVMLQRVGLRDTLFIAMSNYYYEEQFEYLQALNAARAGEHNLTPFLQFALKGIELQCQRLLTEIRHQVSKSLFRSTMADLFGRLSSPRTRVMSSRQIEILNFLLEREAVDLSELYLSVKYLYNMKHPTKAFFRDIHYLVFLGALDEQIHQGSGIITVSANLSWPTEITDSEFIRRVKEMPKGKQFPFLSS